MGWDTGMRNDGDIDMLDAEIEAEWEARRAAEPRNRLAAKLTGLLGIPSEEAAEVVKIIEEMIEESASDLRDRQDKRGLYDPDY